MNVGTTASDFFVAGGTLRPDTPSYVERPTDDELFHLALTGEFCYVLTPRQMGKSSLMVRTAKRLGEQEVNTAIIDLTRIGAGASVEQWYLSLLTQLARRLRLSVDPVAWWQERTRASLGYVQRFIDFLRHVMLTAVEGQIVIFIDEIDRTLKLDFRDDFFAAIRATYNARAYDPEFGRLTFVLFGVVSPLDLIKDPALTPFNIGHGIALQEFSQTDAAVLREGLEAVYSGQSEAIFTRIYHWTNGHPYLTQKLCLAVAEAGEDRWTAERVDELVERLFLSEEARNETNLKFVQDKIRAHPHRRELFNMYKKVLKGKKIRDDGQSPTQNHLKLSGLVKAENGVLRIRNEIYRRVFNLAWVRENTAVNWTPIVAGISVFITLLAIGAILYNAWVGIRLDSCVADFYQTNAPEERLAHLARIFRLRGLFGPADYDYKARELFYGLSWGEQLALFDSINVYSVEEPDLVGVVRGLYVALADVGGTGSTTPLLKAMASALGYLDETEESERLRDEINSWLEGRELARQDQHRDALAKYDRVVDELNGENPATRYERAQVLIELSEHQLALSDLDQVIAIASRSPSPTPTPLPSTVTPITSSTMLTMTSPSTLGTDRPPIQMSPPGVGASPIVTPSPDITAIPTPISLPVVTETSAPTQAPEPVSIVSDFATFRQIISAVRDLIYSNRQLVSFLARTTSLEYPYLRESVLVPQDIPDATRNCGYFLETGHYVCDEFLEFYETRGGYEIFGYPITEAFEESRLGLRVQYFQRVRMEWHPHNPEPYKVQLGMLVDELGYFFPPVSADQIPAFNSSLRHYFPETGHVVSYAFLDYFHEKGGLDIFGYPRSEFMYEDGNIVQYFQRARMEWHPEIVSGPQMRLTNLGEVYFERFGIPGYYDKPLPPPESDVPYFEPIELQVLNVSASVRYVITGLGGDQTVFVYVTDQRQQPIKGADVKMVVHYQSGDQSYEFDEPTNDSGFTGFFFYILPEQPPGQKIMIDVTVTYNNLTDTTETWFLPWW